MNTDILLWSHKESAGKYLTGITDNDLINIIEGKYQMGSPYGLKFDVPVKVEFKKLQPYYLISKGNKIIRMNQPEYVNEYKKKRYKVKLVEDDYEVVLEWENLCSNGSYFWSKADGNLSIEENHKQLIKNKIKKLKAS